MCVCVLIIGGVTAGDSHVRWLLENEKPNLSFHLKACRGRLSLSIVLPTSESLLCLHLCGPVTQ